MTSLLACRLPNIGPNFARAAAPDSAPHFAPRGMVPLPWPAMAESDDRRPWRVRYRVGLGVLVSLLLAATVAVIGWATFSNTRAGIVELTSERIRDLLRGLEARVRSHLESAATAAELSARLVAERAVADDPDSLAHAFTQVPRAHPAFPWASYSEEDGKLVGAYLK